MAIFLHMTHCDVSYYHVIIGYWPVQCILHEYTRAHIHQHIYTHKTHTLNPHTCTPTHIHTHTLNPHTCTLTHQHTHTHTHTYKHTHIHTHIHTHTHIHSHTNIYTHTHTHTPNDILTSTNPHVNKHYHKIISVFQLTN